MKRAGILIIALVALLTGCADPLEIVGPLPDAGLGSGELFTVPCTTLDSATGLEHAVQLFPGESKYELEASVFYVETAYGELAPLNAVDNPAHINAGWASVTDGSVDILCPPRTAAAAAPGNQVASIQIYQYR